MKDWSDLVMVCNLETYGVVHSFFSNRPALHIRREELDWPDVDSFPVYCQRTASVRELILHVDDVNVFCIMR